MANHGTKNDEDKLRWELLPPEIEEVVRVFAIGAKKYGDRNWEGGLNWSRLWAAANRHLWAWRKGITVDHEDGQHPLASVVACCLMLMHYERHSKGVNDFSIDEVNKP